MAKKSLSVKLQDKNGDAWFRETWYGYGPFTVAFNEDGTATVGLPDTESQILTKQTNDYGDYYAGKFHGGTVFISKVAHDKYGNYVRIKLGDNVQLPDDVLAKINYKPTKGGNSGAKRAVSNANTDVW